MSVFQKKVTACQTKMKSSFKIRINDTLLMFLKALTKNAKYKL